MRQILLSMTAATAVATFAACSPATNASRTAPEQFIANISQYCGKSFEGTVMQDDPPPASDIFSGQKLVMHVSECSDSVVMIPFHVGEDHSRTWILTLVDGKVRLKHDHRMRDGSEDVLTMYGGDAKDSGTEFRQEFPVDQYSIDLLRREGLDVAVENQWAMELEDSSFFIYELSRPDGRMFKVAFNLTKEVETPPTPWGY